jgi:hypothetical protein
MLLAGALLLGAEPPTLIAIRNAKIVPVSGPVIPKGTVVMRGGLIEAVGDNVAVPAAAWVVEGEGLTVYPGLIDALGSWGLPQAAPAAAPASTAGGFPFGAAPAGGPAPAAGPEDRPATTSWQKAADLITAASPRYATARGIGFTTAAVFPTQGIFAGQGSMVQMAGERPGEQIVAPSIGQYIALRTQGFGRGFPDSLMGAIAYVRQLYLDAAHYAQAKKMYAENPRGLARPVYDRALEGLLESPRILLPAQRAVEIERYIRFGQELKQPFVLYGGREAYRSAALLKAANVSLLVGLRWPERPANGDPDAEENFRTLEVREKAPSSPAALEKAGVKFAFYSDGIERRADLWRAVKRAMDAGLSADAAVRALTLSAAEIYGLADRLGSIERGKIANLLVTKGELFLDGTTVQHVFIDGVKYDPAPETPAGPPGGFPAGRRPGQSDTTGVQQ